MAEFDVNIEGLAPRDPNLNDYIIKGEQGGISYRTTVQKIANLLNISGDISFRGDLLAADSNTATDGWYIAKESSDYTSKGTTITVSLSNTFVVLIIGSNPDSFSKVDIPLSIVLDSLPTKDSANGVESNGVVSYNESIEVNRNSTGLNNNFLWEKGLVNEVFNSGNPYAFVDIPETQLSEPVSLVDESEHGFDYKGKAVKVVVNDTASDVLRVVLKNDLNIDGGVVIDTGDSFKMIVEIKTSRSFTNAFASIKNSSLQTVGSKTFPVVAGEVNQIVFDCVSANPTSVFYFEMSMAFTPIEGGTTYIGRVEASKSDFISLESTSNQIERDLKIKGFLKEEGELSPRNLLDVNKQELESSWRSGSVPAKPDSNLFYQHANPGFSAINVNTVVQHVFDDNNIFNYRGNVMKVKLPNNNNFFFYLLTQEDSLNATPTTDKLYFNFEAKADSNVTVNIRATTSSGAAIGTNLGNIVLGTEAKVFNLELDRIFASTSFVGVRFIVSSNSFGNNIYIGKTVVSDIKTTSVDLKPISVTNESVIKYKVGELGDSKVAQQKSLPKFIAKTGHFYSTEEIDSGKDGYKPTGVGGTRIIPTSGNVDSIYNRADDFFRYGNDVCIIYGGANDARNEFVSDNTWQYILGSYKDAEYTGDGTELDFNGYRAYWQSVLANNGVRNPSSPYDVTFASCYKGIVKKLQENQPNLKILVKTCLIRSGGDSFRENVWLPMNNVIKDIAVFYGLKVIDIDGETSINKFNQSGFFDAPLVHENDLAGERISELMIKRV